jgi:dihydropteroate synthase
LNGLCVELERPAIMGVVNLTPDSFSDGGQFIEPSEAVECALVMVDEGASIIDLGAESTRPGSQPVDVNAELARLLPVLDALPKDRFIISVDSYKPEVQTVALERGAHIINDVLGGSQRTVDLVDSHGAGLVLMHCPAPPRVMQQHTRYPDDDVVRAVRDFFRQRMKWLDGRNVPRVWLDPGIGFGKTLEQNLLLMRELKSLRLDGAALLLGTSRKSWIDKLCDAPDASQRLGGSIASAVIGAQRGAEILRVHDVHETRQALMCLKAISGAAGCREVE